MYEKNVKVKNLYTIVCPGQRGRSGRVRVPRVVGGVELEAVPEGARREAQPIPGKRNREGEFTQNSLT